MGKLNPLTFGFMEFHPRSAADAIENLDPVDAAAFLEDVPGRISAPVLSFAAPWAVASWVELLPPGNAAAIMQHMSYQDATAVLRLVADQPLETLLDELPTLLANRFRRSLTYPEGTVGAWMDPSVPTFSEDTTVAEGLKYLKSKRRLPIPHLIVVGPRKIYAGIVPVSVLLRSAERVPLAQIMDETIEPLPNRALLGSVLKETGWDQYPALPVVGRKGNVLGILPRGSLRKGLAKADREYEVLLGDSIPAQLTAGYFHVLSGLLRILVEPGRNKHQDTI